jgi:hypothetical protein
MARKIPPMPSRENLKFHDRLSMEGLLKIIHEKMASAFAARRAMLIRPLPTASRWNAAPCARYATTWA